MIKRAFFFQGDSLLLPADFSGSQINEGLPAELADDFKSPFPPDIFEIPALDGTAKDCYPSLDGFAVPVICTVSFPPEAVLPANWKGIPVRQILAMLSGEDAPGAGRILRACHIAQWRRESRYCGTCGAQNEDVPSQAQRNCPKCGRSEFPRICPAIIVVITNDDNKILLAHNKRFRAGVYSHISGFNEAGETLEETVVRETREEVNIEVCKIEYVRSQPWPFPNSLMAGFKARYLSGTVRPDGDEIEDAKWFSRDNLPELPGQGSLSRLLIGRWLEGTL